MCPCVQLLCLCDDISVLSATAQLYHGPPKTMGGQCCWIRSATMVPHVTFVMTTSLFCCQWKAALDDSQLDEPSCISTKLYFKILQLGCYITFLYHYSFDFICRQALQNVHGILGFWAAPKQELCPIWSTGFAVDICPSVACTLHQDQVHC